MTHRIPALGLLLALLVLPARGDELTTLSGKKLTGQLVAVDAEGVTFRSGGAEAKISAKEVLTVDLGNAAAVPAKDAKYHEVELTDGSVLRCGKFAVKGKKLELELLPAADGTAPPKLDLPLSVVSWVCRNADDAKHRDNWRAMLRTRGKRDLYVMRQADGLNFLQGTILDGTADGTELAFEKEDGTKDSLRLSRATGGLVFGHPAETTVAPTLCKVNDVFGNTLVARAIAVGGGVKVTTVAGVEATYPAATAVARLDYGQGNVAYLSDLVPQVEVPPVPEADKSAPILRPVLSEKHAGAQLTVDGTAYPRALNVLTDAALTFDLKGDYREFRAVAGFANPAHAAAGDLKLVIEADGKVVATELLRGAEKGGKGLAVDVKGVRQLRLAVERERPSEAAAYLILADAKVVK